MTLTDNQLRLWLICWICLRLPFGVLRKFLVF